jgi:hypothetical protein
LPTETQTVTTSADFHVIATDWLRFTNQNGFVLGQATNLRISGDVDVVRTAVTGGEIGVNGIRGSAATTVSVEPGGTLHVAATVSGGVAIAYFANDAGGPVLMNSGEIIVSADAAASGVVSLATSGVLNNAGQIMVSSLTGDAIGVRFNSGFQRVTNSGVITVTGHGKVTGVDMGQLTGQVFVNTGTIVARDDSPTTTSVGVRWGVGYQAGQGASFVNDGRIEGDQALLVEVSYGSAAENLFTNNGVMAGAVWLGGGAAETLINNGLISGAIRLIGAGSVYDGRLGSALGSITGSNNGGNTLLGGAGAETMTGGLWSDTISSGAGDDLVDGGGGSNRLDGGAGLNTLTFASLSNGVELDLAAGTARFPNGDQTTFTGFSQVIGSPWNDTLRAAANSSVAGGAGADTIVGAAGGPDYLRGDDGSDSIQGGSGFDDINGNMGNDSAMGGAGDDWVVGGKDNDVLGGQTGRDLVYGNLGSDTCDGGDGDDIVRGGQDDDVVSGGEGDDFVSGDRGSDTMTGGAGADMFHTFGETGIDRVTDFNLAQGDRVQLDPGTQYTVAQVGADTVISMTGGGQMVLLGVQMTSLTPGWILGS